VVAVVETVAVLVTVVVVGCPLTVFVGRLTVAFFVEVTVVVDCGFLALSCVVTVSVLPTPATSPITTHSRAPATNASRQGTQGKDPRGRRSRPHRGQKSASCGTCVPQFGQFTNSASPSLPAASYEAFVACSRSLSKLSPSTSISRSIDFSARLRALSSCSATRD
jgi:hypothetical protein